MGEIILQSMIIEKIKREITFTLVARADLRGPHSRRSYDKRSGRLIAPPDLQLG